MAEPWLCLIDEQELGPYPFVELQDLAWAGHLKPTDRVRPVSHGDWRTAKDVPDLLPSVSVTTDAAESLQAPPRPPEVEHPSAVSQNAIPVGTPVVPAMEEPPLPGTPALATFIVADTKNASEKVDRPITRRRSSKAMPLLIFGGVTVVAVALLALLAVNGTFKTADDALAEAKTKPATKSAPVVEEPYEEVDPGESSAKVEVAAAESKSDTNAGSKPTPLLNSVTRWNDISRVTSLGLRGLPTSLHVQGLWLSGDLQGTPLATTGQGADQKLYLFIRFVIRHAPGAAPLDYQSYRNSAVLFDEQGKSISPIATDVTGSRRIGPGESLEETLAFPLPSLEFERFRLVLPHAAIGVNDAKSFGLELPRNALGRGANTIASVGSELREQIAGAPNGKPVSDDPAASMVAQPRAAAAKVKADDIHRKLEELEAKAKALDKMETK